MKAGEEKGNDRYLTVARRAEVRLPVGACRFIASVSPADSEEKARDFISSVRGRFDDANHHAYAYRIGWGPEMVYRSSDDREPAGTAGEPILHTIKSRRLSDVVVVSSRYFGGVEQGIGGLIRAYRGSAESVLEEAGTRVRVLYRRFWVEIGYDLMGNVMHLIEEYRGRVEDMAYSSVVRITASIPAGDAASFRSQLTERTGGRARFGELG